MAARRWTTGWPAGWKVEEGFDLEQFLAQPLMARVATVDEQRAGPVIAPVWFLWEDGSFWWLTGSWSKLANTLAKDPRVAFVVDTHDVATGAVKKVYATGTAVVVPLDTERTYRKLSRYLGPDKTVWDPRFGGDGTENDPQGAMVRLTPERLMASDSSYTVGP